MYAERLIEPSLQVALQSPFVTLLLGPRRTGKSTLIAHYLQTHPTQAYLHMTMDDWHLRKVMDDQRLTAYIEEQLGKRLAALTDRHLIVIDEAQKCPALFEQIKILYDQCKETGRLKFVLTGSGSLSLHQRAAESLAGRVMVYALHGFALREAMHLRSAILPEGHPFLAMLQGTPAAELDATVLALQPSRVLLEAVLSEQLVWGGFPEVLQLTHPTERITYLANYRQTYLEKDIRALEQVENLKAFDQLVEVIAQQTGSLRSDQHLLEAIDLSRETLKKYRRILEATLLYTEIEPYIGSTLRRIVKAPKAYLADEGLISHCTGLYEVAQLERSGTIGTRFENWVLRSMQTLLTLQPLPCDIRYWRTSGNVEIDFILDFKRQVIPVECKYASQPDHRHTAHLRRFLTLEKKAPFGVVIYRGEFRYDVASHIYYFPAWALV